MAEPALARDWPQSGACGRCGTELAPALLVCPSCLALVHADTLKQLAAAAERAQADGDTARAVVLWRQALDCLPKDTKQYDAIVDRVTALGDRSATDARQADVDRVRAKYGKHGAIVSAIAVFLLKFKFVIILLLLNAGHWIWVYSILLQRGIP